MKRIICITIMFLLTLFTEGFSEVIVPPPPIDIDISNSSFEKIDSTKFRIRDLTAPAYPGSYWVDFLWDRDQLLFQPTSVGEETSSPSGIKVAFVSKSGYQYSDPIAAMNDIASWCGTPSESNPCLVKILPGVYNIGANTLQMQSYVDVEGSGEEVTKIKGNSSIGVVSGGGSTEIRFLTVEHTGEIQKSIAVNVNSYLSQKLTNITILSTAGTNSNYGVYWEFFTNLFDPPSPPPIRMKNVTIIASGGNESIGVEHKHSTSDIIIEHSSITGTTNSIRGFQAFVAGTQLNGHVEGNTTCAGVYDENFTFYANTCP